MNFSQSVVGEGVLDSGTVRADVHNKSTENNNLDLIQRCFNMSEGNFGWCGTCIDSPGLSPGQPGYCGANATGGKEEATVVEADRNWGFCNKQCYGAGALSGILQVDITIIPFQNENNYTKIWTFGSGVVVSGNG